MAIKSNPLTCYVAQVLLRTKQIEVITPKKLANLMNISSKVAGFVLKKLCWRKSIVTDNENCKTITTYYYDKYDVEFSRSMIGMVRIRVARLLGIPKESIMDDVLT